MYRDTVRFEEIRMANKLGTTPNSRQKSTSVDKMLYTFTSLIVLIVTLVSAVVFHLLQETYSLFNHHLKQAAYCANFIRIRIFGFSILNFRLLSLQTAWDPPTFVLPKERTATMMEFKCPVLVLPLNQYSFNVYFDVYPVRHKIH
ncbi:hypothetical protein GWI33_009899 [Rhynchophorus ferrugineus]|uniref:Uncharacterized protein n=1 Tax=Rhynchophorus ferrugineus TaxID=354439 RepID=A0A834IDN0_RHYFE|nr:hypothetical protein GWI33_009899 [Rhynchophorus ferrugineus]